MYEIIKKIFDFGWDAGCDSRDYDYRLKQAIELYSAEIRILILEQNSDKIDKLMGLLDKMK